MADLPPDASSLQASLVNFALAELVRQHRQSFQPLWTAESWTKLLIWLALNCGCSGDEASLKRFAEALGPAAWVRLRRVYFEREFEDLQLQVMADPAEAQVLMLPLGGDGAVLTSERIGLALERVGLSGRVVLDQEQWGRLERAVVIPRLPHP
jgi:hypothetical protein